MSKCIVHKLCLNGRYMGWRAWSNKTRRRPHGFEYYMLLSHVFVDFNICHILCLDCTQSLVVTQEHNSHQNNMHTIWLPIIHSTHAKHTHIEMLIKCLCLKTHANAFKFGA